MKRDIAIIGMSGKFPEANSLAELYSNLKNGRDSVRGIPQERLEQTALSPDGEYKICGYMEDVHNFDHKFFGIPFMEAKAMCPEQRMLLQTVYHAIENSGYSTKYFNNTNTAVYIGSSITSYYELAQEPNPTLITGNGLEYLASRISRQFNLTGTSAVIDASCSSSLVALHLACNEILIGDADMAIVAGVTVLVNPNMVNKAELDVNSPDGKSRAFSAEANGASNGEAVASVILKPLEQAVKDRDNIHAVIKGSSTNNNGNKGQSMTAPDSKSQVEVLKKVWAKSGLKATDISFIETHGTGTKLGDSLEFEALTSAFKEFTDQKQICPISTIKSNIGHCRTSSGIVSICKTALSLKHKVLFPTIHFKQPNPLIDFANSALYVNTEFRPWEIQNHKSRYAGVSGLGASGTNCHVVLQEFAGYSDTDERMDLQNEMHIPVSAKSLGALQNNIKQILEFLMQNEDVNLHDVAYTLTEGRDHFNFRKSFTASNVKELISKITRFLVDENVVQEAGSGDSIFITSDSSALDDSIIETLKSRYSVFRTYWEQCESIIELNTEGLKDFSFQYALFHLFKALGFDMQKILPLGIGAIVFDAFNATVSLEEALQEAQNYSPAVVEDTESRVAKLLSNFSENQQVTLIDVSVKGILSEYLSPYDDPGGSVYYIAGESGSQAQSDFALRVVSGVYPRGFDTAVAYTDMCNPHGRKIELPAYSFDKIRCWLIDEPVSAAGDKENCGAESSAANKAFADQGLSVEEELILIWEKLLEQKDITPDDDFFYLGGHSIIGNQLINIINERFGSQLEFGDIFVYSTVRDLSEVIESRTNEKKEAENNNNIKLAPIQDYYPLTHAQRRMWFINHLDGGNSAYNNVLVLELHGRIHIASFEQSIRLLIKKHEALRSVFTIKDGAPCQFVYDASAVDFKLTKLENALSGGQLEKLIQEEKNFRFNLEELPLLRCSLVQKSPDDYICILNIHHLISDGWSMNVFQQEFIENYDALSTGEAVSLKPLEIQMKDYAVWQHASEYTDLLEEQEKFWQQEFEGDIPRLNLPLDFKRPEKQQFEGKTLFFSIDRQQTDKLKKAVNDEGVTAFIYILSVLNITLYKLSNQEDVIVGTPINGRRIPSLEPLIGLLANVLAIRNQLSSDVTFKEFVSQVKAKTLSVFDNQDYPFEKLVGISDERDTSRNPVFDVMFAWQNMIQSKYVSNNLSVEPYPIDDNVSMFDLLLEGIEKDGKLEFELKYNTSLFKEATAKRIVEYFCNTLAKVVENENLRIGDISLILESEKHTILHEINNTQADFPRDVTVIDLFEKQCSLFPEAIALKFDNQEISYSGFSKMLDKVACYLGEKGVKKGDVVGIVSERSFEMMAGIYGIMKAGGVYLPIAPDYPDTRKEYILNNSEAKYILLNVDSGTYDFQGKGLNLKQIIESADVIDVPNKSAPGDTAYIIYTSGSTGNPKGVMIKHDSLVNRIHWMQKRYPISAGDVILQKTPVVFDVSIWELFWWATEGASLSLLSPGAEKFPEVICDFISKDSISVMHFVPSMLNAFLSYYKDNQSSHQLKGLNYVFSSGEALLPSHANLFNDLLLSKNNTKLVNLYGPTEATVDVSYFDCFHQQTHEIIPIGKPIDNTDLVIIDKNLNLQPPGVIGELCIGGVGLALGYKNNESLTKEKFIPNPFKEGELLYKTGDLARWLEDGNIQYIGRDDGQIKLRGHRIELSEIEINLSRHPRISQAVVIHKKNRDVDQIIAFYASDDEISASELSDFLGKDMPVYMIPAQFVRIETIPLTHNGKADRKQLDAIEIQPELQMADGADCTPQNDKEAVLLSIWQDVLNSATINVKDNFFRVGGDSIKTIQIQSKLRQVGYLINTYDIFNFPTIETLSERLKPLQIKIDQSPVEGSFPLSPVQSSFFRSYRINPHHFNHAVVLLFNQRTDENMLSPVFEKLVEHHDMLRACFKTCSGQVSPSIENERKPFSVDVMETGAEIDESEFEQICNGLHESIRIDQQYLLKACLVKSSHEDRLIIVCHHLLIDGISWRVLLEDISSLLQAQLEGAGLKLPLKTHSFKVWTESLKELASSESMLKEADYWNQLTGSQFQPIQPDYPVRESNYSDLTEMTFTLDQAITDDILTKVHKPYNTTINDILLTALGMAVKDVFDVSKMAVMLEGHGREEIVDDIDVSRTIGWFTSVFPVVINCSKERLEEQIIENKEVLHKIPNNGIGYGMLKEHTSALHNDSFVPQIEFNFLGQFQDSRNNSLYEIRHENVGRTVSPHEICPRLFMINGIVDKDCLKIDILYNTAQFKEETVYRLSQAYQKSISTIRQHCLQQDGSVATPSDFDFSAIEMEDLDSIFE